MNGRQVAPSRLSITPSRLRQFRNSPVRSCGMRPRRDSPHPPLTVVYDRSPPWPFSPGTCAGRRAFGRDDTIRNTAHHPTTDGRLRPFSRCWFQPFAFACRHPATTRRREGNLVGTTPSQHGISVGIDASKERLDVDFTPTREPLGPPQLRPIAPPHEPPHTQKSTTY